MKIPEDLKCEITPEAAYSGIVPDIPENHVFVRFGYGPCGDETALPQGMKYNPELPAIIVRQEPEVSEYMKCFLKAGQDICAELERRRQAAPKVSTSLNDAITKTMQLAKQIVELQEKLYESEQNWTKERAEYVLPWESGRERFDMITRIALDLQHECDELKLVTPVSQPPLTPDQATAREEFQSRPSVCSSTGLPIREDGKCRASDNDAKCVPAPEKPRRFEVEESSRVSGGSIHIFNGPDIGISVVREIKPITRKQVDSILQRLEGQREARRSGSPAMDLLWHLGIEVAE